MDIIYLCGRKSAGIDFTLNANTIKREKEVVHSLHDLASLYTASVLCQTCWNERIKKAVKPFESELYRLIDCIPVPYLLALIAA